jgi:hypothetical protein
MRETRRGLGRSACIVFLLLPVVLGAVLARPDAPSDADRDRAIQFQKEAVERLRDGARAGAAGDAVVFARALGEAAGRIEALIGTASWLPASERDSLQGTAAGLKTRAQRGPQGYAPDADLAVLDRVGYRLRGGTDVKLVFEGSFTRSKPGAPEEPAYGGHATAMGAPPMEAAAAPAPGQKDAAVSFDVVRGQLTEPTYGGGPSKWHLVESGGNGVALLDYDGDGLLDVYTVSAFDLDERNGRARIPHRNALYRNLGG